MSIWPRPRHVTLGSGTVWLAPDVNCQCSRSHAIHVSNPPEVTETPKESGSDRFAQEAPKSQEEFVVIAERIFDHTKAIILQSPYIPRNLRGPDIPVEPTEKVPGTPVLQKFTIEEIPDLMVSSEWYRIQLDSDGVCTIQVRTHLGLNRAMSTILQLFFGHSIAAYGSFCPFCPMSIEDAPKFQHRGLNLDISRNTIYPPDVQRVLEGMWLNKMNKLHLHATDSQSWPLEIPKYPELAKKGAYHASQIWTVADVERIQSRGQDLGVEVYFEIDLPGHTGSIHHSFPDLIVAYNQQPWDRYAMEPPAGQLKLKSEAVRDFISSLFDDFLPRVEKYTGYFHIGGDELNRRVYNFEEGLESDSKEDLKPLLQKFFDLCVQKLEEHGLSAIVWEDMLLEWDIQFPSTAIFQSWKSQESLAKIVNRGHRALFGPCHYWYLDCGMGMWLDPNPANPDTPVKHPFKDWCSPYKSWRTVYAYDPFEGIDESRRSLIHGGEVHLWGEMVDSVCLDFMLWPRVSAAAETLWTGPSSLDESVTRRLAQMRERLVLLGIRSGMVQMQWSLQNPGCSSL
jgi:hexosaminidase